MGNFLSFEGMQPIICCLHTKDCPLKVKDCEVEERYDFLLQYSHFHIS